jgi:hypothetical protein
MFVMPGYFMFLPVVLAILALRRICAGTLLFLPYALLGFPPVDSFDWWLNRSLWSAALTVTLSSGRRHLTRAAQLSEPLGAG